MADAPGQPVWAYGLRERTSTDPRYFEIALQTVSELRDPRSRVRTGLTLEQVQAALTEERASDPYIVVRWASETRLTLEEWHQGGSVEGAWQQLTGVLVDPWPRITEQSRAQRTYGPSNTYFSPGGFGSY